MKKLEGKIAVITGAGNGIGKETALLFAAQGAAVVVVDINGLTGESTVAAIKARGGESIYINAHVAKESDCKHMIEAAEKHYGKIDILFNNAGIMHPQDTDVINTCEKTWDMTMSVNAKSVFLSCKYGIPALLRAKGGAVINAASFVALCGSIDSKIAYTASKGAVLALSRDLAARYAKDGIRVNTLCPGPIFTEAFANHLNDVEKKSNI